MIRSRRDTHGQRIGLWERLDARLSRCDTLTFSSAGFAQATLLAAPLGSTHPSPSEVRPAPTLTTPHTGRDDAPTTAPASQYVERGLVTRHCFDSALQQQESG